MKVPLRQRSSLTSGRPRLSVAPLEHVGDGLAGVDGGLARVESGVTDIGFRVYYEQKGERRFIIGAEEIPPPTG